MKLSQVKKAMKQLRKIAGKKCSHCGSRRTMVAIMSDDGKSEDWRIKMTCSCNTVYYQGLK